MQFQGDDEERDMKIYPCLAAFAVLLATGTVAGAQTLPDYMAPIAGNTAATPAETATKNVLALNTGMFELYGDAAKVFQKNILSKHPVILGLFSGRGGRFILYRPGHAAARCAAGADRLSTAEIGRPQHDGAGRRWSGHTSTIPTTSPGAARCWPIAAACKSALDGLDATPMPAGLARQQPHHPEEQHRLHGRLLDEGRHPVRRARRRFGKKQAPYLKKNVAWAAQTQVAHWMTVLADWKTLLGADWDKTYAASNTIYVARQNNVLFSVLAQFFGPDAINDRLILIETMSFTTTPADMLESLTRIIADRSVGALFFGNYHLMDYELMGGDARAAIIAEDRQARHEAVPAARRCRSARSSGRRWSRRGRDPRSIADLLKAAVRDGKQTECTRASRAATKVSVRECEQS